MPGLSLEIGEDFLGVFLLGWREKNDFWGRKRNKKERGMKAGSILVLVGIKQIRGRLSALEKE